MRGCAGLCVVVGLKVGALTAQLHDPARDALLQRHKRAIVDLELRVESATAALDAATATALDRTRATEIQRRQVCWWVGFIG